jgi:hypothetical protein
VIIKQEQRQDAVGTLLPDEKSCALLKRVASYA